MRVGVEGKSIVEPAKTESPVEQPTLVVSKSSHRLSTIDVYDEHELHVIFKVKEGSRVGETIVKAEVTNQGEEDVEDLQLLMITPRYIQMQMKPLSSDVVPARNEGVCSQLFRLRNNQIEEKDTVVKLRLLFRRGTEEFDDTVLVDSFSNDVFSVCWKQAIGATDVDGH